MLVNCLLFCRGLDLGMDGGFIVNGSWFSVYFLQSGQSKKILDGINAAGKEGRDLRKGCYEADDTENMTSEEFKRETVWVLPLFGFLS